jgi:hypothetical protein
MQTATRRLNAGGMECRTAFHLRTADVGHLLYPRAIRPRTPMSEPVKIQDRQDRWRFTCPRGHRTWEPTNHHFWCARCARAQDVDGVFHELRDRRDGRLLAREEVRLLTPAGPYDADLDGRGPA